MGEDGSGTINISTTNSTSAGNINITTGPSNFSGGAIKLTTGFAVGGNDIILSTGSSESGNRIELSVGGGEFVDAIILKPGSGIVKVMGSGTYTGTWAQASDERYKSNIKPLFGLLNKVQSLKPVEYDWKKEEFPKNNFPDGNQIGLIAQEVEKLFPELVATNPDGYKSIDYSKISVLLIQAMKEQQNEIEKQSDEISNMKSDIEELKSLILQDANNLTSN